ncbi:MAG TPA: hypothetical protein VKD69_09640, partial [Vicinamibacterales bacterium]|nr:hypothetical protein [Vicinamibacterales bacterium]
MHTAPEPAAQILNLARGIGREAELFHHASRAALDVGPLLAVEPREGEEVVPDRQKKLGCMLLNDDDDPSPHVEGLANDVEAEDTRVPIGGPDDRGQDPERRGFAGAVWTEQPEDRATNHREAEIVDGPNSGTSARTKHFHQVFDPNHDIGHDGLRAPRSANAA